MGLYDLFGYSAGLVVLNVFTLLFSLGNIAPMAINLPGYHRSSGAKKVGAEGHYYGWGIYLGVRRGDLFDGFSQFILLPLKLVCWVPLPLCQYYTVLAEIYWGLTMVAVIAQLISIKPTELTVTPYANMVTPLFVVAILQPFLAALRCYYFVIGMLSMEPTLCTSLIITAAVLYCLTAIQTAIVWGRCYGIAIQITPRYMNDLWLAHESHMKQNNAKWDEGALHPAGFDPLLNEPQKLLQKLREDTNKPLATAEEINEHIENFMDENTMSFGSALVTFILSAGLFLALPPIFESIIEI